MDFAVFDDDGERPPVRGGDDGLPVFDGFGEDARAEGGDDERATNRCARFEEIAAAGAVFCGHFVPPLTSLAWFCR